jgi:opacity protein-like surface antigen
MKINKLALLTFAILPSLSLAELSVPNFKYTYLTGTISQVTIEEDSFEDIHGYEYSFGYSHELTKGAFLRVSYTHSVIDDEVDYIGDEVDASATFIGDGDSFSVVGGKAIGISKAVDVYGEIGFGYSTYELDTDAEVNGSSVLSASESDSDVGIAAGIGMRLALDSARRVELNPTLSIGSSGGDTSKTAGLTLAIAVIDNVQLGLGAAVDLDDEITQLGGGIRLFF